MARLNVTGYLIKEEFQDDLERQHVSLLSS